MKSFNDTYQEIRLILGDQLNIDHSWFRDVNPDILYVMMEIKPESEYVTHHIQKITGIFASMREFAAELNAQGHHIKYFKIGDSDNFQTFELNLQQLTKNYDIKSGSFMEPDEYRLDIIIDNAFRNVKIPFFKVSAEHFYTERDELDKMFVGKSTFIMESFYRRMRKKHHILMDLDEPMGGKWNFDLENRKKLPKGHKVPSPMLFSHDVSKIVEEIENNGLKSIGSIDEKSFYWPITRNQSVDLLEFFCEYLLPNFGNYQDAMSNEEWSLYHSRLSFALNIKLISPREVIDKVQKQWEENRDEIQIQQVEGFIRQILGWREYMRGIYWSQMPSYEQLNFFEHKNDLPEYFWTGKTKMNCINKTVTQSLNYAYAHHIQRLMVTGNFSLLTGIDPDEVDRWYLGIYIDAFQWVEITNTRGMSQFADGGIVGTKPYISSASYINKMSDYCGDCRYKHTRRVGEHACPFNSLYWRFLAVHEDKLASNQRMSMMYRLWHKMDGSTKQELLDQAEQYLEKIDDL